MGCILPKQLEDAMSRTCPLFLFFLFAIFSSGLSVHAQTIGKQTLPDRVSFNAHIRPLMSNTCFACHGPDEESNPSDLRLDSYAAAVDHGAAIEPGDAEASAIFQRIMDDDDPMPPVEFVHRLTDYDKALIGRWIQQGADYESHWSYSPIRKATPPRDLALEDKVANDIDRFIFRKLQQNGLEPSSAAEKATLLRRLSLDLVGLPPTREQLRSFLADDSADAYQKQVERLLDSPQYGERMASQWLDVVRFSDTAGFHGDQNQRIFPYRDYVINAINDNMPFDQFTREQLAGDLLESPTEQQRVATGLIRLNMMTREGGAQPEEYLAKYTADRVRMLGTAWLGSTTGCCECHNHKYDPFSIRDFYSLGAFFDDVRQWGVYSDYRYTPNKDLKGFNNNYPFPPEIRIKSPSLDNQIRQLERSLVREAAASSRMDEPGFFEFLNSLKALHKNHPDGWLPLKDLEVQPAAANQSTDSDKALFVGKPKQQTVTIRARVAAGFAAKSIRMEVLPDPANNNHVGRSKDGKFSLSFTARIDRRHSQPADQQADRVKQLKTRFVRIAQSRKTPLSLAEVQLFAKNSDGKLVNVATDGKATQSSTSHDGDPQRAIDGSTSGDYSDGSVTHTGSKANSWWEVDLGREFLIENIKIWNRTDGNYGDRLSGFQLTMMDKDRVTLWKENPAVPKPALSIAPPAETKINPWETELPIVLAQADRFTPKSYSSGQPPIWLGDKWTSGPIRWQLPENETQLPHTAVFHLKQPVTVGKNDFLEFTIKSKDVGKVRIAVSPLTRFVAGDAINEELAEVIQKLDDANCTLGMDHVLLGAWTLHKSNPQSLAGRMGPLRDEIAKCHSGYAMSLIVRQLEQSKRRQSRILPRGDWQSKDGQAVDPDTPEFLPRLDIKGRKLTRMDLANWLTDKSNPLVARHFVNRTWKHFFGSGLSAEVEDLGNQGQLPTHPELLDTLAASFQESWDMKALTRKIVTSHTYRQRAAVRSDLAMIDPYNRLLSQQSARRLEAEAVRDNALAISGLLFDGFIGGPSVSPYQPAGHYSNLQFPNRKYKNSIDFLQYRRGVYMHWQRTFLHPMLVNFDAPSRDECTANRPQSNSPQQALTLLNDPQFVEASHAFAQRVLSRSKPKTFAARIEFAFQTALSRPPTDAESTGLKKFLAAQQKHYADDPDEAIEFLDAKPIVKTWSDTHDDPVELAAWSQLCRVILNLHETITRF